MKFLLITNTSDFGSIDFSCQLWKEGCNLKKYPMTTTSLWKWLPDPDTESHNIDWRATLEYKTACELFGKRKVNTAKNKPQKVELEKIIKEKPNVTTPYTSQYTGY